MARKIPRSPTTTLERRVVPPPRHPAGGQHTRAAERFLLEAGLLLHRCGLGAPELERTMDELSRSLRVRASFLSLPTALEVSMGPIAEGRSYLLRANAGEADLGRLSETMQLVRAVRRGALAVPLANRRRKAIAASPPRYGAVPTAIAYGLVSLSASLFMGGSAADTVTAFAVGLLIGLLAHIASRLERMAALLPAVAALTSAIAAHGAALVASGLEPQRVALAGVIVLIPGLSLTVGVSELATHHLMSGSARLMSAAAQFFQMGFGLLLGLRIAEALPPATGGGVPLDPAWSLLGLAAAPVGLLILFRARPQDLPVLALSTTVAASAAAVGRSVLGPELGALAGAVCVGITANAFARISGRPAMLMALPGTLLLVPGSIGFQSVASLLAQDVLGALSTAAAMALTAAAIVTGLLIANVVVPPEPTELTPPRRSRPKRAHPASRCPRTPGGAAPLRRRAPSAPPT